MAVANIVESYSQVENRTGEFIATRESLLSRLRHSDNSGWREFFETYWKLIYNTARRSGLTDVEAQDVVQETMIGVSRNLPSYVYRPEQCAFKTWLMNLTHWRIVDQIRKRSSHMPLEEAMHIPEKGQFQAIWDEDWERNLIHAAMEKVKTHASPADFQIFSYCVLQRHGVAETARFLNISTPRVYLARHRISRAVTREVTKLRRTTGNLK